MTTDDNNPQIVLDQGFLDRWLEEYPERPNWQDEAEVRAEVTRLFKQVKPLLEKQQGRGLTAGELRAVVRKRMQDRRETDVRICLQGWIRELRELGCGQYSAAQLQKKIKRQKAKGKALRPKLLAKKKEITGLQCRVIPRPAGLL